MSTVTKELYCRLVEPTTQQGKEEVFLAKENRYVACSDNFAKIPGAPVAYWGSENVLKMFDNITVGKISDTRLGMATADNDRFLRFFWEINYGDCDLECKSIEENITSMKKWFPYAKGGNYRKWYGNNERLVNWFNNGISIRSFTDDNGKIRSHNYNLDFIFKKGITWNALSSSKTSFRCLNNALFDNAGSSLFLHNDEDYEMMLAFLNSKLTILLLPMINPTLNYQPGTIASLPFARAEQTKSVVKQNIALSKSDWDAFETSWDFTKHPLLRNKLTISEAYAEWETECNARFAQLKANEEELNRIFIDIYGLQDELTPEVEDKDVTVRKADLQRDIKSLLSYAVGCMFGRYSLDVEGLTFAGGTWDESKYVTFKPDEDNVIPITDEDYFEDDIIGRLIAWLKVVYGAEMLEENLRFIADALGTSGDTARQKIRNYFLKDFFKDHCKIYQKRPIYWLYDSGKQNGFKALIYMHRYNADTSGQVRAEYLGKMEETYESEINRMQDIMDNGAGREVALAGKRKEKLQKQLHECRDYDAVLGHIALASIAIDLDDGVKVNYVKVQTAKDGKLLPILAKI